MADEILTGEGVALQISAASVITRAGAWLLDALATGAVLIGLPALLISVIGIDKYDQALATAMIYVLLAVVFLVVPITVETLTHGRSLGKVVFGLQVIRDDGGPIRVRHATARALVGFFELWLLLGGLAFVTSMLNDRGKRVGDFLAGTYVAHMRGVRSTVLPLGLPAELAGWVQVTDIRPLPDGLAMRARQFLSRAHQFPPPVRYRLGLRLAAQLELFVAPAPPFGTYPEQYIAAVLFERRRREQAAYDRTRPRLAAQLAGIENLPYGIHDPES
ncbi:MAG TPA: RDD family protein [Propionicimonas sp.]|nr:RDD family protein [Propionicimonas sp.]